MRKRFFTYFVLIFLFACQGICDAEAAGALSNVRIYEGINQRRPASNAQSIGRRYVWTFKQKHYTVLMDINVERYNSYSSKERRDIPKLVNEGTEAISDLTREFQRVIKGADLTKIDKINFVLGFVQSLPYTYDDVTTGYDEFRRYAIETLIEGGGDCEDTTILTGAILRGLGEKVALIDTPGHVALGASGAFTGDTFVYRGTKYYYCETTGTGWTVGKLPPNVGRSGTVTPLTLVPAPPEPSVVKPSEPVTKKPKEEPPKPEREGKSNTAVIAVLFLLIGLTVPVVYFVTKYLRNYDRTEEEKLEGEEEEEIEFTASSRRDKILKK